MRLIKINPADPEAALKEAAEILRAGGLVAYPTETFYGLGADALNPDAVAKVFAAKGRGYDKPISVIVHDKIQVARYVRDLSGIAVRAIELLMPGPVTMVFRASGIVPGALTAGTGKVGIRVPKHEAASGLARVFGSAITATSANISGKGGLTLPEEVLAAMEGRIDALLDGGVTPGAPASTLMDLTVIPPEVLREGRLGKTEIAKALGNPVNSR